ncbi:MAG: phosphatidate cytidylyltransferase [Elusimicrobiaceae bacterium]|jgi:phosphatidate cytidylyltransferase|nr:phosphatidate cytidylyltransferase [Elusimicrobiaceae bacterium]MBT3955399.1 phosphatidate cytidylyltransferase [Elusimicrobiaceae bacterium]MBT4007676.1 phosphatidate cytidylyltransferase [Elusimicrobiaceae bacterium]MBT4402314.1 phosphatidate cytidylyltransferase [Elusimicrobiaceae bacterium]MBT4439547.1 phosphatidate cytidylyltransferase [Elusimicrobiaceae bacterium]
MLLPRIITSLIGIPLVIAAVHIGNIPYIVFIGCIMALCLYEYGLILKAGQRSVNFFSLILFGLLLGLSLIIGRLPLESNLPDNLLPLTISVIIFGVVFFEIISRKKSFLRLCYTFFGIFFITWTLVHLISIREIAQHGEYLTIILFVSVWACDISAYFAGTKFGRHALNADVSPKKSWEGAIAGVLGAVMVTVILNNLLLAGVGISTTEAVILGFIIGVVGQISDLAESLIKRSTGVKDSSNLLPGHGGILDRFDSFILLAPIFYYAVLFFIL